jgi:hypothetical protein
MRRMILVYELDSNAVWAAYDGGPEAFGRFLRRAIWGEGEEDEEESNSDPSLEGTVAG